MLQKYCVLDFYERHMQDNGLKKRKQKQKIALNISYRLPSDLSPAFFLNTFFNVKKCSRYAPQDT